MARTKDGKVYANKDGLEKSIKKLVRNLEDIEGNRKDFFSEMSSFMENYSSPVNSGRLSSKVNFIDDSLNSFIGGENKVVEVLLPDVIDRFEKGYIEAMKMPDKLEVSNNASYEKKIEENIMNVENSSSMTNSHNLSSVEALSNVNDSISYSPDLFDLSKNTNVGDIDSNFIYSSQSMLSGLEIVGVTTGSAVRYGERVRIDVNFQVNEINNNRIFLAAILELPIEGKIGTVDLVLSDNVLNINSKMLEDLKKNAIVVVPQVFEHAIVAKLVLELANNPSEIINTIVKNTSMNLNYQVESALEINLVSFNNDDLELKKILEIVDFTKEVDNVYVANDSKLKLLD